MKVLLMKGQFNEKRIAEPLGISLLASLLRENGFADTHLYDPHVDGDSIEVAAKKVLAIDADILGISMIEYDLEELYQFIQQLRQFNQKMIIVIGGYGPSLMPESFLLDGVQAVFVGESDITFPDFVKGIAKGKAHNELPGLAYKDQYGKMILNPLPDRVEELEKLPWIARDILQELQQRYPHFKTAQISSSRGCYMSCSYCSIRAFSRLQGGKIYRERQIDDVVRELQYLHRQLGIKKFIFEDDNFIPQNPEKARAKIHRFYQLVKEAGMLDITMQVQCRPDNIQIDLIEMLKEIGLKEIFIGIESINEADLKLYNRVGAANNVRQVIAKLNQAGFSCDIHSPLRIHVGYINFNPYSTRETLKQSSQFLRELRVTPKKLISYLRVFYNTPLYQKLLEENLFENSQTCKFINPEIAEIFHMANLIIKSIMKFRELLRATVKANRDFGADLNCQVIEMASKELDELCFDLFDELVTAEISWFNEIRRQYLEKFNMIKERVSIDLLAVQNRLAIDSNIMAIYK